MQVALGTLRKIYWSISSLPHKVLIKGESLSHNSHVDGNLTNRKAFVAAWQKTGSTLRPSTSLNSQLLSNIATLVIRYSR